MAYNAYLGAEKMNFNERNFGQGTWATFGKLLGIHYYMKIWIRYYGIRLGNLTVGQ